MTEKERNPDVRHCPSLPLKWYEIQRLEFAPGPVPLLKVKGCAEGNPDSLVL
ncbi:hypothetical protein D3C76_1756970 [compost metagenome]